MHSSDEHELIRSGLLLDYLLTIKGAQVHEAAFKRHQDKASLEKVEGMLMEVARHLERQDAM